MPRDDARDFPVRQDWDISVLYELLQNKANVAEIMAFVEAERGKGLSYSRAAELQQACLEGPPQEWKISL